MKSEDAKEKPTAEDLLKSTARNVSELASMATHQIGATVNRGKSKLGEMQAALADKTTQCARQTDQYVHDSPWQAIGIAAGLGLIIGLLIRRR